jgi:hypothetical protein
MPRGKLLTVNAILVSMARRCVSDSISAPAPGQKWAALARHSGYTTTDFVKELVERAEWRVTARLPSRAQGLLRCRIDSGESFLGSPGRSRSLQHRPTPQL